jgi:hypothetical protein
MVTQRRRRIRPLPKPTHQPYRRKRPLKPHTNWKGGLVKSLIALFVLIDVVLILFIIRQCSKPPVEEVVVEEEPKILQIEVLNGCGVPGIAGKYMNYLRKQGFDVIRAENYETFNVLKTVVIERRGKIQNGIRIASALGLGEDRVLQEVNEAYLIDATVILGKDYNRLEPWGKMEHE